MSIKWGTPDKIRFIDPLTSTPLELGVSGEMNLQVADSRRLLLKLVGTQGGIAWDEREGFAKSVRESFRPMIVNVVKTSLPAIIRDSQIDLLEIDERVGDISSVLRERLLPGFAEYGLSIPQFYVTHVVLPEDDPNFRHIRELHTIALQARVYQAEATVKTVQAQSEASYRSAQEESKAAIAAAQRKVVLEQQTTETEVARREAERQLIRAQADAEARRMAGIGEAEFTRATGLSEAEVMRAKGYTERDVLEADVKKAYAAGLGQMGANGGGSLGDVAGLGVTLGAMGGVINMTKNAVAPMFDQTVGAAPAASGWDCPSCGRKGIASNFCPDCGTRKPEARTGWDCTCGEKNISSNFCPNCGAKRPLLTWVCPDCGLADIKSNFCPNCGRKKEG